MSETETATAKDAKKETDEAAQRHYGSKYGVTVNYSSKRTSLWYNQHDNNIIIQQFKIS